MKHFNISSEICFLIYGFLFAFLFLGISLDISILNPANISWLTSWDHSFHYLGWKAFRSAEWGWPLGSMNNILYPIGTVVQNADSIPLLAIIFKIFDFLLPEDFQYFGIWFLFCWSLQFYAGTKICSLYSTGFAEKVISGILFATLPLLIHRVIHPALCAHWLILFPIYFYIYQVRTGRNVSFIWSSFFTALASLIHPYLLMMSTLILFAVIANSQRKTILKIICFITLPLISIFSNFITSGDWFTQVAPVAGFGEFKADLSAFINCYNTSFWSILFKAGPGTYEGYAFLGLGSLLFSPIIVAEVVRSSREGRRFFVLLLPVLLMFVYSLSSPVELFGEAIFENPLYQYFSHYTQIIRSSGRFIWPIYYCIVIIMLRSCLRFKQCVIILLAITSLNLFDSSSYFKEPFDFRRKYLKHQKSDFYGRQIGVEEQMIWQNISNTGKVLLVPNIPQTKCAYPSWNASELNQILYLSAKYKIKTNIARVARYPRTAIDKFQSEMQSKIYTQTLSPEFVFLVKPGVPECLEIPGCKQLGSYYVCQSNSQNESLSKTNGSSVGELL
jgi:hypothetical protein